MRPPSLLSSQEVAAASVKVSACGLLAFSKFVEQVTQVQ